MAKANDQAPQPLAEPHIREKFKRRLHSPGSIAPNLRARQIQVFSWAISLSVTGYVIFLADFGTQEHCFSPVRRWFETKRQSFWTLSPQERQDLKEQGKL
ncbi:hypothetical protein DFQ28_002773 [Apophysomyces sp. BC1034]|nr:hypothetical protein DFQ30_003076 [Apophysomyces sp. BC1015]KAG0179535.1 hypothetical protein DFQ29_001947 [Apophysomyces sp. BC1021]KAG0189888.1 hypothetical protein DFQ28_002773 [Apophysomyces sp. BC1034]